MVHEDVCKPSGLYSELFISTHLTKPIVNLIPLISLSDTIICLGKDRFLRERINAFFFYTCHHVCQSSFWSVAYLCPSLPSLSLAKLASQPLIITCCVCYSVFVPGLLKMEPNLETLIWRRFLAEYCFERIVALHMTLKSYTEFSEWPVDAYNPR